MGTYVRAACIFVAAILANCGCASARILGPVPKGAPPEVRQDFFRTQRLALSDQSFGVGDDKVQRPIAELGRYFDSIHEPQFAGRTKVLSDNRLSGLIAMSTCGVLIAVGSGSHISGATNEAIFALVPLLALYGAWLYFNDSQTRIIRDAGP